MIPIIYDTLLLLMLISLYFCGKEIAKTGKVCSKAGIIAILSFTLNEGLRFGRGIDYNVYGMAFERYANGEPIEKELLYSFLVRFLINVGIPFQGLIIFQSFLFITCLLYFLVNYRDIMSVALPFFVLFSLSVFENLIRWYLGFSFIVLGLSLLISGKPIIYFISVSSVGVFFHVGLLPIPILFYLVYRIKNILFHPLITISVYLCMVLFVKTEVLLYLVDFVRFFSFVIDVNGGYVTNAEEWLTKGVLGSVVNSGFGGLLNVTFLLSVVWYGYYCVRESNKEIIFIYNLFILGFMLQPLANRAEILVRYNFCFYCFAGIISSVVLIRKVKEFKQVRLFVVIVVLIFQVNYFRSPFIFPEEKYLYVWDAGNRTYSSMYSSLINIMYNNIN